MNRNKIKQIEIKSFKTKLNYIKVNKIKYEREVKLH